MQCVSAPGAPCLLLSFLTQYVGDGRKGKLEEARELTLNREKRESRKTAKVGFMSESYRAWSDENRDGLGSRALSFAVHYSGLFPLAFLANTAAEM